MDIFKKHPKTALPLLIAVTFLLGTIIGDRFLNSKDLKECDKEYQYINFDISCGGSHTVSKAEYAGVRTKIENYIAEQKSQGLLSNVSVYFRDLQGGPTFGINQNDTFTGASLLKLPVVFAIYKLEEETPGILERQLRFTGGTSKFEDIKQIYPSERTIVEGEIYSIKELVSNSVIYSDNISNDVLKEVLRSMGDGKDLRLRTFQELGLITSTLLDEKNISVQEYASLFRLLYQASYLSVKNSEEVLSLLAQASFDVGIAAGLPPNIKVANKFGERFVEAEKQLHDCGIVYYPSNPYVLCVMTRGYAWKNLESAIKTISEMVYKEFNSRKL